MLELQDIVFEVPLAEGSRETKRIIDGISLTIDTDKFVVITGPNGGGKSTLAKLIMGIEKPTSGKIIFKGQDITNASITERARMGVGYGFQQPARFKGMKVKKLLELAAGKRLPMLACNEYLSEVGLCSANYLTREVDKSLSGGELKRIEIATVLAANPDLAIYDEPEAGIDLWSFDRLTQTFKQLSNQERIIELADEIICLRAGKIESQGSVEEILPQLGLSAKENDYCSFTEPPDLHLTEISTNC